MEAKAAESRSRLRPYTRKAKAYKAKSVAAILEGPGG